MEKELIQGIIASVILWGCLIVELLLIEKMHRDEMKKHYTIQVDDKVFVDIWALRISKFRRSVTFKDIENGETIERHIFFDELHVMKLEGEKNEKQNEK